MKKGIQRPGHSLTFLVPLFFSVVIGLIFLFKKTDVLPLISTIALLPVFLYLLFFNRNYFLSLLIFCVPLSVSVYAGGGTKVDFPSEPFLGAMALLLLAYWFVKPVLNKAVLFHPVTFLVFFELIWMMICALNGDYQLISYKRCLVRFSFIIVFYMLFTQWMDKPASGGKLFIIYAAACVVPVLHGFAFHAHFQFSSISAYLMPRPFFTEHTIYGACLAFLIPMLLIYLFNAKEFGIKSWKFVLLFLLTLLVIAGEFFSFSRAAWLSLGVALVFSLLIYVRVKLWMILLVLSLAGIFIYKNSDAIVDKIKRNEAVSNKGGLSEHIMSVTNLQTDASNLERINRWKCAIRMAKQKPVTGFGPGTYQFEYGRFQSRADMTRISTFRGSNGHAHSEIFNALSEEGIPGMLIYIVLMFSVIGYGLKVIYQAKEKQVRAIATGALLGLITFYVHGLFNAFLDTDKMAVLVFGSIAIIVCLDVRQRKNAGAQLNEPVKEIHEN